MKHNDILFITLVVIIFISGCIGQSDDSYKVQNENSANVPQSITYETQNASLQQRNELDSTPSVSMDDIKPVEINITPEDETFENITEVDITEPEIDMIPVENVKVVLSSSEKNTQSDEQKIKIQSNLTQCPNMNSQFSCNVFDISYCGSVYDKMNRGSSRSVLGYYEVVGANGYIPMLVSCREGEFVGERSDTLYCVLWGCRQISEDGIIKGYGGQFGIGEYQYHKTIDTSGANIYTYTLLSCAETNKVFDSNYECTSYVMDAENDMILW